MTMTMSQLCFGLFWAKRRAMGLKRVVGWKMVECRRGEVDYGYVAVYAVKRV